MSENIRTLKAENGLSSGLGLYLAGMNEVSRQVNDAIVNLSPAEIGRPAVAGAHSIGALVLHIGESEWWWMNCVISGHKLTAEDRNAPFWDVLINPESFAARGCSADFCLNETRKIRKQTRDMLSTFSDEDLDRVFTSERRGKTFEYSLRWILHHLIDHEAQHKGQILMLKRLLGKTNEGPFN
jgi:uncharacterized damage-inducible protein DinB